MEMLLPVSNINIHIHNTRNLLKVPKKIKADLFEMNLYITLHT